MFRSTIAARWHRPGYARAVPGPPLLRRRTVLLGTAAVAALTAGCDHGDDIGGPTPSAGPSSPPSASASAPEQTPDEALVETVSGQLTGALGVVATARRFKPLRTTLTPLLHAHRRHIEVLEGDPGWTAPALADPAAALQAVHRSEQQLRAALVEAADRAESGALARLLASMSASVTQHLAVLPREVAR